MNNRWIASVAVVAAGAARVTFSLPWWVMVGLGLAAVLVRRPPMLCLAIVAFVGVHADHELAGLRAPPPGTVDAWVTLVADGEAGDFGASAEARLGNHRVVLRGSGAAGSDLVTATMGTRLHIRGRLGPLTHRTNRTVSRHLAAAIAVSSVEARADGGWPWVLADRVRAVLSNGAASVGPEGRALFEGLVLGDDRRQDDLTRHRFRASGLSHLLVVSGENVAFVLVAAAPLLNRLTLRSRFAATLVVLIAFGTIVRWEPSVLRAIAMSAVAALAGLRGRHASGVRVISIAVLGLVAIDPLIVWSMGFLLSVAATLGLVLFARPIGGRLPGPRWLADALGVVFGAQLGAAPVLVFAFGVVPAAGLVANLVAVPVAGWVMVWGCTAGFVAGVGPSWVATIVHLPTRAMEWWIAAVARVAATPGLPQFGAIEAALVALAIGLIVIGVRPRWLRVGAIPLMVVAVALGVRPPSPGEYQIDRGATLIVGENGEAAMVLGGRSGIDTTLDGLSALGVGSLDVLVVTSDSASRTAAAVGAELGVSAIVASDTTGLDGARRLADGRLGVGTLNLDVKHQGERWTVTFSGRVVRRGPV